MEDLSPRTNTRLFGHTATQDMLLADFEAGRLPHGLLIAGPRGTGKATLAWRLARAVLAGDRRAMEDADHPVFRRMVAGGHADFLAVEPLFDEKKGEAATSITVEQAREVSQFLSLTAGEGAWRVVIVDSADALGTAGANAILKTLEEPPPRTLLMLISHQPGGLLATIRSRCRMVRLAPLEGDDVSRCLRHALPELPEERAPGLARLSGGSPGLACLIERKGGLTIYEQMLVLVSAPPAVDAAMLHGFADLVTRERPHEQWPLISMLALRLVERAGKRAAGLRLEPVCDAEPEVLAALAVRQPAAAWAARWQQAQAQFSLAERLHLDYKQAIIAFFNTLCDADALSLSA